MLSNLFPTARAPSGGIFVTRRIESIRAAGHDVVPWALAPQRRGIVRAAATVAMLRAAQPGPLPPHPFHLLQLPMGSLEYVAAWRDRMPVKAVSRASRELVRHVQVGDFDLIVAHGMYMLPAGSVAREISLRYGVPYVTFAHGGDVNYLMARRAAHYAQAFNEADHCVFVSSALADRARKRGMTNQSVHVIPNGVDTSVFYPSRRTHGRNQWGFSERDRIVAFVGNMLPVKGADRLPQIVREIQQIDSSVKFVFAGDGPLLGSVRRLCGSPVTFLGRLGQEDVADVMAMCDLLMLPSRNEGWPTVIFEAFASGTPVVGAAVGGIPEALGEDGGLVPDGVDFETRFAHEVLRVLANPARVSHLRAIAEANEWRQTVSREIAVFHNAVLERRAQ